MRTLPGSKNLRCPGVRTSCETDTLTDTNIYCASFLMSHKTSPLHAIAAHSLQYMSTLQYMYTQLTH